jgi:acyl-CoA thioester hydrolase
MISTSIALRVRYKETDQMGIVHHANYFPWFEMARVEMLDAVGLPYRDLEALGLRLPVLQCAARFRASARFDDRLEVTAMIRQCPGVRFTVEYEVHRASELLATGQTEHAFITPQGRPTRPPDVFTKALAAFFPAPD